MQTSSDYSSSESKTSGKAKAYLLGPIVLQGLWLLFGIILIAAGTIDTVPTQDAGYMSAAQKQAFLERSHTSATWSAVWWWGELAVIVISGISLVYGLRLWHQHHRKSES